MGEIASASDEQSRGIDQVALAVSEMDRVTQQNAALVQESAAAAAALEDQASRLKMADFTHDVRYAGNGIHDVIHGLPCAFHQHGAGIDAGNRVFNQGFNLFRRVSAAAGEITHFTGHHRKPAPLFTRTRGRHCLPDQYPGAERRR